MKSVILNAATIKKYDGVVVAVDHTHVDYKLIYKNARFIFDVKNIFSGVQDKKIVRL